MEKNKFILILASVSFLSVLMMAAQSHEIDIDHEIEIEIDEDMSSDEVTEMVLEIINEGVEVGEKALKNALATIKIKTGQSSLPDLIEETSPAVVRIAIRGTMQSQQNPFFDDPFFDRLFPQQPREREFGGGGSGVIIDGLLGYLSLIHI